MRPKLHLWVGAVTLAVFVLQGQYMFWVMDLLQDEPDGARMLYRSSHLYLFLVGAINVVVGTSTTKHRPDLVDRITSGIFLLAPLAMLTSFAVESQAQDLNRPISSIALQLVFAAVSVLALRGLGVGRSGEHSRQEKRQ